MSSDGPIVDEVRQRASQISEQYQNDLRKYADHLKQLQDQFRDRLVNQITVVPGKKRADQP